MSQPARMVLAALLCSALVGCGGAGDETTVAPSTAGGSQAPDSSVPATPASPAPVEISSPPATSTPPVTSTPPATSTPVPLPADRPIPAAASSNGNTTLRVRSTSDYGAKAGDGVGAFRLPCLYSHMAFDDPIVYPGQPGASHLHIFFGNTSTDGITTTESLLAAKSSTCAGGIANLSAYWVPAMIDTTTNRALLPGDVLFYYKSGYNSNPLSNIVAPPNGLRMVAGNKVTQSTEITGWSGSPNLGDVHYYFECGNNRKQSIVSCPVGQSLLISLSFPNCWDGKNLDSPDHRSHMAHSGGGKCPASHPVALPEISLNMWYPVTQGQDTTKWRLSSDNYSDGPGGYSMHGDVWIAWQEDIKDAWVNNCVKAGKDCHAYLLGDGRVLY
jgi:hypothetical protein